MSSFTSDDRGITEPYTDLPALGIITIGILIFCCLIFSAYSAYASGAYYVAEKEDLRTIALALSCDPVIAADGSAGILVPGKLGYASGMRDMLKNYGPPGTGVAASINAGKLTWELGREGRGRSASYRLPVSVALNDAMCVPGTLTITVWEDAS